MILHNLCLKQVTSLAYMFIKWVKVFCNRVQLKHLLENLVLLIASMSHIGVSKKHNNNVESLKTTQISTYFLYYQFSFLESKAPTIQIFISQKPLKKGLSSYFSQKNVLYATFSHYWRCSKPYFYWFVMLMWIAAIKLYFIIFKPRD